MYEYKFEHFILSPERLRSPDFLQADMLDIKAIIEENAAKGWRYIETLKLSPHFTLCMMVFERESTLPLASLLFAFTLETEEAHL